jgi:hypothetical protein
MVVKNSQLFTNRRFLNFIHIGTETKTDFTGLTLCVITRQVVQIGLRPKTFTVPIVGRNSNNPPRNAQRNRWRSFFNRHHNSKKIGC